MTVIQPKINKCDIALIQIPNLIYLFVINSTKQVQLFTLIYNHSSFDLIQQIYITVSLSFFPLKRVIVKFFYQIIIQRNPSMNKLKSNHSSNLNSSSSQSLPQKSQSKIRQSPQFFNNQSRQDRLKPQVPHSESQEDSSDQQPKYKWKKQIEGVVFSAKKQLLSDSQDDKSIQQIQQRIKRLEKDLQQRIDKHKQYKQDNPKKSKTTEPYLTAKGNQEMAYKKNKNKNIETSSVSNIGISHPQKHNKKQNESSKRMIDQSKVKPATPKTQAEKGKSGRTQNKGQYRKTQQNSKISIGVVSAKQKIEKNDQKSDLMRQVKEAKQIIQQMQKKMNELTQENRQLREQNSAKKRIKSTQQYERLREITGSDKVKLDKELQLLKIIESLQNKLKKSIAKKLKQTYMPSTTLLHKGFPSHIF